MTILKRAIVSILLCAAVLPALAEQAPLTTTATASTREELIKWKNDVLDRYKHVVYLDPARTPISEAEFFHEVREHHAAFSMTHDPGSFEKIVVRLLSPDEVRK